MNDTMPMGEPKKKGVWWKWALGILGVLLLLSVAGSDDTPSSASTATSSSSPTQAEANLVLAWLERIAGPVNEVQIVYREGEKALNDYVNGYATRSETTRKLESLANRALRAKESFESSTPPPDARAVNTNLVQTASYTRSSFEEARKCVLYDDSDYCERAGEHLEEASSYMNRALGAMEALTEKYSS